MSYRVGGLPQTFRVAGPAQPEDSLENRTIQLIKWNEIARTNYLGPVGEYHNTMEQYEVLRARPT